MQVAEASVLGASALMLPSAALASEDGAAVVSAARALDLEVVVEVDSRDALAVALGVCVCVCVC